MSKNPLQISGDEPGTIMVVDDQEPNRRLLRDVLEASGHRVLSLASGEAALASLEQVQPDTILLDVMMPGLDGFEVCREIRRNPAWAHLPVLLVTSLSDREARLEGIAAGANDFISKPIDPRDMLLRVRNSVFTKRLFDRLQESYRRLRELEELRDDLTHLLVHDLRSPLAGALGFSDLLSRYAAEKLDERGRYFTLQVSQSLRLLNEMVSSILDVSRIESGQMPLQPAPSDLAALAGEALTILQGLTEDRVVQIETAGAVTPVPCDADLIRRVFTNLLANALRYSPDEKVIVVRIQPHPGRMRCSVVDAGPGIPEEYHERVFEKFGQADVRRTGPKYTTGLGLTFCKLVVEAHGGTIGLISRVGEGSTFWFELPSVVTQSNNPAPDAPGPVLPG